MTLMNCDHDVTLGDNAYIYIYIVLGDVLLTVCGSTLSGGDVCGCVAP